MPRKKTYEVALLEAERNHPKNLVSSGSEKAWKLTRARILLKADERDGGWTDGEIAEAFSCSTNTRPMVR